MQKLLTDERFRYWPVCSVAFYALREKILSCSLSAWYLYNKRLGIIRYSIQKKKKYETGIIAGGPNEIWHADITIVKTRDNIKHYIYLLMDNFSRYILSWRIETYLSAKIRVETIREAYRKFTNGMQRVLLTTDGGPENDNNEMKSFVGSGGISMNQVIALKDIPFSNSVIEAQNRLFKYRYLFRQDYKNGDELKHVFASDVSDYNNIRPHISLGGYTPSEAQTGTMGIKEVWKLQIREAAKVRLAANRNELCEICR